MHLNRKLNENNSYRIVMKTLIVYYSRTGRTKKIAEEINKVLDGDIEEVQDMKPRSGIIGWLGAGKDAGSKTLTTIKRVEKDPSQYDLIVIGSPTWNGSVTTPIRTYIEKYKNSLRKIALFSTGDSEDFDALDDMDNLVDNRSIAKLHLARKQEIDANLFTDKVKEFVNEISAR
jgi:flavodoxin